MTTTTTKKRTVIKRLTSNKPGDPVRYGEKPTKKKLNPKATLVPRVFPDINQRCKQIRDEMRLTQFELADRIGITVSMVKSVENIVVNPNLYYIISLSNVSGKSTDYILKGKK